ncbi:MAG TPA: hypothetical protein VII06_33965 [Chloroflexota bacterium]|jgi:hypothetical protein
MLLLRPAHISPRAVGTGLLVGLLAVFSVALGSAVSSPVHAQDNPNAQGGAAMGFTAGWLDGQTVQFFYTKDFFCRQPPTSGASTQCEVGADGQVDPRPGIIPVLYVMTPLGFRPDASTLHCPVVGSCINHPSTIDLSRLFGPSAANAPLPAHSHVVDQRHGGWWELKVIGVKDLATWNQVVAGKSLATVRALQAADPGQLHINADTDTNTYLFFDVRP